MKSRIITLALYLLTASCLVGLSLQQCDVPSCKECSFNDDSRCFVCDEGFSISLNKQCEKTCKIDNCITCKQDNSNICDSCSYGYIRVDNSCKNVMSYFILVTAGIIVLLMFIFILVLKIIQRRDKQEKEQAKKTIEAELNSFGIKGAKKTTSNDLKETMNSDGAQKDDFDNNNMTMEFQSETVNTDFIKV